MTLTDPTPSTAPAQRVITLRFAGECACGAELPVATRAGWNSATRTVTCLSCLTGSSQLESIVDSKPTTGRASAATASPPVGSAHASLTPLVLHEPAVGVPGESLQRAYEQHAAARAARVKADHRYLGGLILALTDEPDTTKAFKTGASGERRAAAKIVKRAGSDVLFLFNRSLGAGRRDGDIDLIAVGPSGVSVVDVKCYPRAQIEVRHSGPLRSQRQHLMVRGRDKTDLLDSLSRQVLAVRAALDAHPYGLDIPIASAFCFIDATLPTFAAHVSGVPLLGVRGTAKLVASAGVLAAADRASIHAVLAQALPPAR